MANQQVVSNRISDFVHLTLPVTEADQIRHQCEQDRLCKLREELRENPKALLDKLLKSHNVRPSLLESLADRVPVL
jgi:hypothetical protein